MKQAIWIVWLGAAAAIFWGAGSISTLGHVVFWGMLATHLAEFAIKRPVMAAAGGSMRRHFVQTLIYGLFHWKPLEASARATERG